MRGNMRNQFFTGLLILCQYVFPSHQGKIQDWERACVVGECLPSASSYNSCAAQPLDVRLGHPSRQDVTSEPVFRNRPETITVESCDNNMFIPLCCPLKKTEESMVIGGLEAEEGEFPHQVRILIKTPDGPSEKCGGTIYNKDYILTAASCVVHNGQPVRAADVQVIVGQNIEHQKISKNIHPVRDIKVHEGYTGVVHAHGMDNDLALLRMRNPLQFSSSIVQPVKALRIPEKNFNSKGLTAIIMGWGRTASNEKPIGTLLKMNAYINKDDECVQKSMEALKNGNHFKKTSLITPRDEFGDIESFEVSKTRFSSKSGRRTGSGSLFDNDDFFKWGRGTSLAEWDAHHELVNLGALRLGKLWEGGIEHKKRNTGAAGPLSRFPNSLLCVGGGSDSHGYNRGDSGGPAICEGPDGSPILCGISSYGRNEYLGEWPATYVNVAHYADWIRSHAGRQQEDTLIKEVMDGEPIASPDEASFFIRIRNIKSNKTCGGALINSRTVVSSVECVPEDVRVEDLVVTSGEFATDNKGTEHEVGGVATRETYKNYQSRSANRRGSSESAEVTSTSLGGDFPQLNLAVLKLYRPARSVKHIPLIKPHMERMIVYEYGWRTDGRDKMMNRWAYREVTLGECKARYGAVGIQVDENHLCGTETYTGGERCNKELGNPVVCVDRQMKKYLCAVTSFRDCSYSFPTVFTNIRQNLDWIQL